MNDPLTQDMLKLAVPKTQQKHIDQTFVDKINNLVAHEEVREQFKDNILSYSTILQTGKYKLESYVGAVKFCTFLMLGTKQVLAYSMSFPDKYQKWITIDKLPDKTIGKYVSAFKTTELVQKILEQARVPAHLVNAGVYQEAINKQASIMNDPNASFKVQSDAANSLLTHLKPPETHRIEVDIGTSQPDAIADLVKVTQQLADQQQANLQSGVTNAKQVAHSSIINHEKVINP